jgi:ABC-type transporter Mla subunit MlaD
MQYGFRGSSPSGARNSNSNPSGFRSPAAMETGPGVVPIQVYQQVAEELESARQQVSLLSSENQHLRALHQQLSGELAAITREFQGQLGHTLKRLQQISLRLADANGQAA